MFTRLLIGLDGSATADEALEQAILLGRRFGATLVIGHVQERGGGDGAALVERARARVGAAGGVAVEAVLRHGDPRAQLAALARTVDAVLIGRRGASPANALGSTAAALIRTTESPVIVCGGKPSPMRSCAVAYDGRETSQRALALAGRFASIAPSELHIIHATIDRAAGTMVVGEAEATLSLQGVAFVTHLEHGTPGEAVARVVARTKCDALFAGAHVAHGTEVTVSHAEEILRHTDIPVVILP
jgi:nucleotide-binding universal stress UspA family protein